MMKGLGGDIKATDDVEDDRRLADDVLDIDDVSLVESIFLILMM